MEQKFDIFLSYRRTEGWELARLIYEILAKNAHSVFLDVERLYKGKFDDKLRSMLKECKIFIPILTRNTLDRCVNNKNDWVRQEIEYALDNKIIIPIVDDSFVMPDSIEQEFKNLIDTKKYPVVKISKNNYDEAINDLHKTILKYTTSSKNQAINNVRFNEKEIVAFKKMLKVKIDPQQYSLLEKEAFKRIENQLNKILNNNWISKNTKDLLKNYLKDNLDKNEKINILEICGTDFTLAYKLFDSKSINSLCLTHYHPFYLSGIVKVLSNKLDKASVYGKQLFLHDTMLKQKLKPWVNKFDVVIFSDVLNEYKNIGSIIKSFNLVLKKNGIMIITQQDNKFDLVFPDENNVYAKYKEILNDINVKTNTNTNELIYPILKNNKFNQLSLFTNFNFNPSLTYFDKEKEFNNFYQLISDYLKKKSDSKMGDEQSAAKLKWIRHNYDLIHDIVCADKTLKLSTTLIWMAKK